MLCTVVICKIECLTHTGACVRVYSVVGGWNLYASSYANCLNGRKAKKSNDNEIEMRRTRTHIKTMCTMHVK